MAVCYVFIYIYGVSLCPSVRASLCPSVRVSGLCPEDIFWTAQPFVISCVGPLQRGNADAEMKVPFSWGIQNCQRFYIIKALIKEAGLSLCMLQLLTGMTAWYLCLLGSFNYIPSPPPPPSLLEICSDVWHKLWIRLWLVISWIMFRPDPVQLTS